MAFSGFFCPSNVLWLTWDIRVLLLLDIRAPGSHSVLWTQPGTYTAASLGSQALGLVGFFSSFKKLLRPWGFDWSYTPGFPGPAVCRQQSGGLLGLQSRESIPQNKSFSISVQPIGSVSLENPNMQFLNYFSNPHLRIF